MSLAHRNITVMGLGSHGGGTAALRYAVRQGARVTVTDLRSAKALQESLESLGNLPLAGLRLGEHRRCDFLDADVVIVNPAVSPHDPFVAEASGQGVQITSEMELFLNNCPAQVIGVTGSNGKSTTAAMIATILRAAGRRTWLGGNIGNSLLENLADILPGDWVVVEISSFQLHWLSPAAKLPQIAVVTNFTPNHLDWHGTLAHYRAAKQKLLAGEDCPLQPQQDVVLDTENIETAAWGQTKKCLYHRPWADSQIPSLNLPGQHNRNNAACAAAAASLAGSGSDAIVQGLTNFSGLPHRLELVATRQGVAFYNDSMATTPESVIAALETLGQGSVWLLGGGKEKGISTRSLAAKIAVTAAGGCFYGQTGRGLLRDVQANCLPTGCGHAEQFHYRESLAEAVRLCWSQARSGDVILLSPGFASGDQFRDYRHRADVFKQQIDLLPESSLGISPGCT